MRFRPAQLIALLAALTAADLGLSLLIQAVAPGLWSNTAPNYWRPSTGDHHELRPWLDRDIRWMDRSYRIRTNELGFKDAVVRKIGQKPSGARRLLLMGDSFTEGIGVPFDESFAGLLARTLAPRGIEVLNAGTFKYAPSLYLRRTETLFSQGFDFDEMLLLIDVSDPIDDGFVYTFAPDGAVITRDPPTRRELLSLWAQEHSMSARLAVMLLRSALGAGEPSVGQRDLSLSLWSSDPEAFERMGRPGLAVAAHSMDALADLLTAHGKRLTVAVYPWPDQILRPDRPFRHRDFWRNWATGRGIAFLDLSAPFFAGPPERSVAELFIPGDVHWNARGHATIAEEILALSPSLGQAEEKAP